MATLQRQHCNKGSKVSVLCAFDSVIDFQNSDCYPDFAAIPGKTCCLTMPQIFPGMGTKSPSFHKRQHCPIISRAQRGQEPLRPRLPNKKILILHTLHTLKLNFLIYKS